MDLPTIVAALIEQDLEAAVVARASAGFPVALANEAARFLAPRAKVGEPLGSWIGDEAASDILRELEAGRSAGSVKSGRWTLAMDGGDRWIVHKGGLATGTPPPGKAALDAGTDEGHVHGPAVIAAYEAALAVASEVDAARGPAADRRPRARRSCPARYAALGVSDERGPDRAIHHRRHHAGGAGGDRADPAGARACSAS